MATGFSRTLEGGHDVIYDYCCTTCARKSLNAEALFYCKDCRKLFCEGCEQYHDKFTEGHNVLGRKEVSKWGNVNPVTSSLMCDEHPEKELEMYCEDHGRVCCHTCIYVNHRYCKQVQPVSEVAKGIKKRPEFKSFLSEADMTQSKMKSLYDKQEENIQMLQKARTEITSSFKNMRKKLNQIVDRLEEDSTTVLDRLLSIFNEKVTTDKEACSNLRKNIQKLLGDIQTLGKKCDKLAFQGYKKCCEQMASADKLLFTVQNVDYQIKFIPNVKIEQYLSSLETLGSFFVSPARLACSLKADEVSKLLTPPDHVFSVVNKQTYNVKTSEDTYTCEIAGMCQLPYGQTAIVDLGNTKVKLLSTSTYSVQYSLKLPSYPLDICHTTGLELAVTVCDMKDNKCTRKEIQFISALNEKLSHTRTVQLAHECGGIAYHNAQLYISSLTALYVYDMSGKKIKNIIEDTSGKSPLLTRFTLSDDGSRIYFTNFDQNLLHTLDNSGQQLSTLSDFELKGPIGVCVADNGSVFVSGSNSHTVLQVGREGKRAMTTLATENEGVSFPQSLFFNRKTDTLLVGNLFGDTLLTLQLK